MNADLESVPKKFASIVAKGYKNENSVLVDYYSRADNKMLLSIEFKDSTLKVFDGTFQSYFPNGLFRENGIYKNGREEGNWLLYDSTGRTTDSINYIQGKKMSYKEQLWYSNGELKSVEIKDSVQKFLSLKNYDSTGILLSFYNFPKGDTGLVTYYENGLQRTETLFTQQKTEAKYSDNEIAWRSFLKVNLDPMFLSKNNVPAGTYTVVAKMIIAKTGDVKDIIIENDPGYGMGQEVIRTIQKSGKWQPATIFGKPVEAIRRQPITFVTEGN